jgi:hypothetical protein
MNFVVFWSGTCNQVVEATTHFAILQQTQQRLHHRFGGCCITEMEVSEWWWGLINGQTCASGIIQIPIHILHFRGRRMHEFDFQLSPSCLNYHAV